MACLTRWLWLVCSQLEGIPDSVSEQGMRKGLYQKVRWWFLCVVLCWCWCLDYCGFPWGLDDVWQYFSRQYVTASSFWLFFLLTCVVVSVIKKKHESEQTRYDDGNGSWGRKDAWYAVRIILYFVIFCGRSFSAVFASSFFFFFVMLWSYAMLGYMW